MHELSTAPTQYSHTQMISRHAGARLSMVSAWSCLGALAVFLGPTLQVPLLPDIGVVK